MSARKNRPIETSRKSPNDWQTDYGDEISDEYLEFQRRKIEADYPGVKNLTPVGAPGW